MTSSFKLSFFTVSYEAIIMTLEGTQDTTLASIPFVKDFGPSFFSNSLKDLVIDFPPSTWENLTEQQFL